MFDDEQCTQLFPSVKDNFRRPARDHADPKPVFKKSSFLAVLMIQEG